MTFARTQETPHSNRKTRPKGWEASLPAIDTAPPGAILLDTTQAAKVIGCAPNTVLWHVFHRKLQAYVNRKAIKQGFGIAVAECDAVAYRDTKKAAKSEKKETEFEVARCAEILGETKHMIHIWIGNGVLKAEKKPGENGVQRWVVSREELERFTAERTLSKDDPKAIGGLTVAECASTLGIGDSTIRIWISDGTLKTLGRMKNTAHREHRIEVAELRRCAGDTGTKIDEDRLTSIMGRRGIIQQRAVLISIPNEPLPEDRIFRLRDDDDLNWPDAPKLIPILRKSIEEIDRMERMRMAANMGIIHWKGMLYSGSARYFINGSLRVHPEDLKFVRGINEGDERVQMDLEQELGPLAVNLDANRHIVWLARGENGGQLRNSGIAIPYAEKYDGTTHTLAKYAYLLNATRDLLTGKTGSEVEIFRIIDKYEQDREPTAEERTLMLITKFWLEMRAKARGLSLEASATLEDGGAMITRLLLPLWDKVFPKEDPDPPAEYLF
jgi:hypothetical protein